jgi:hypothetical protein
MLKLTDEQIVKLYNAGYLTLNVKAMCYETHCSPGSIYKILNNNQKNKRILQKFYDVINSLL